MLSLKQCALRRGAKLLFQDANFTIHRTNKVGVTGVNGCGKSSLFSLVRGELQCDNGEFELPPKLAIAHVAQETPALEKAALEYVVDGDAELRSIEEQLKKAEETNDGNLQAKLHDQLDAIGGYTARSRAAQLLSGLGFPTEQHQAAVQSFSGGWRMRLNLAQALMCRSELLLLDEPTNHLDLDAVIWLQNWLSSYPGTLLLISHDRDFLDDVSSHILHIENQQIELYSGNYSAFEKRRAEKLSQQQAEFQKQQRELAHVQDFVRRFRAKASKAKQAQSRLKSLARMEQIAPAHIDSPFSFKFFEPEKLPSPLIQLDKVNVGYENKNILNNVNLSLESGDRIALLGANGAGKSTLIKLLAGHLSATSGETRFSQTLKTGYFAQHQLEQLDSQASAIEHLLRLDPKASEQSLRDFLGGFAFYGDMATESIEPFSGGEKARLALALIVYQRPNLLLLDEPTNHLDLEMRHALNLALQDFVGTLVVISHDRHLLRSITDTLLLVHDGQVEEYQGDLEDYRQLVTQKNKPSEEATNNNDNSSAARKEKRRLEAEKRKQLQPLRKKIEQHEQQLEKLQLKLGQIEQQLLDPAIYDEKNKTQLKELLLEQNQIKQKVDDVESSWMELAETLEEMGNN